MGAPRRLVPAPGRARRVRGPDPRKVLGFILAFGAGVLISAVAYELVEQAVTVSANSYAVANGFPLGALVFFLGDVAIDLRLKGSSGGESGWGSCWVRSWTASPSPS